MKQYEFLFSIILLSISAVAHEGDSLKTEFTVSFNSYASSGKDLPFWFTANQNGAFTSENGYYQSRFKNQRYKMDHPDRICQLRITNF